MTATAARAAKRSKPAGLFNKDLGKRASVDAAVVEAEALENAPRPDMRPDMREETPLERAKRRAAEIMKNGSYLDTGVDEYYIDPSIVPDGWSYEWKRKFVMGQEDPTYQLTLIQGGWEPVPASRHRGMMPSDTKYNVIERKGMVLMERPLEITNQVKHFEFRKAHEAVSSQEEKGVDSKKGLLDRPDARVRPNINKAYAPIDISK